jgi:hypothetical protein
MTEETQQDDATKKLEKIAISEEDKKNLELERNLEEVARRALSITHPKGLEDWKFSKAKLSQGYYIVNGGK